MIHPTNGRRIIDGERPYTFDTLPHLGGRDGIFHCMGYCGQGVPMTP